MVGHGELPGTKGPPLVDVPAAVDAVAWRWWSRASEDWDYLDNERGDFDAYRSEHPQTHFEPLVPASALASSQAKIAELRAALAESDKNAEKLEALLEPHISWDGKPSAAEQALEAAAARERVLREALETLAREIGEWEWDGPNGSTTVAEWIAALDTGEPQPAARERVLLGLLTRVAYILDANDFGADIRFEIHDAIDTGEPQ